MVGVTAWKGTVTKDNHLYGLFRTNPQKASDVVTVLMSAMHLPTLNTYLSSLPTRSYDDDTDLFWDVIASSRRNIDLCEARREDGSVVESADEPNVGMGFAPFYIVTATDWFSKGEVIWGNLNEAYPMIVMDDPKQEGTNTVYCVQMFGANGAAGIPAARLLRGEKLSIGYAPIERDLSRKVGDIHFTTPVAMRSTFSRVRIQHKVGGRDLGTRLCCKIPVSKEVNGKTVTATVDRWIYNVTWKLEETFEEYKNNALFRGVSTQMDNGEYSNFGFSGLPNIQGSGLRELMKAGMQRYYNHFSLPMLEDLLMEISEGKLGFKNRKFVVRTGERGLREFSRKAKETMSGWISLYGSRDNNPANILAGPEQDYTNGNARTLVDEQYTRWLGPNGIEVVFMVDTSYDDKVTNKLMHPKGGTAESYRYDIFYAGDEEQPNVQKATVKNMPDGRSYQWGPFYNPFTGERNNSCAAFDEEACVVHMVSTLGIVMYDPTRCISLIPAILQ